MFIVEVEDFLPLPLCVLASRMWEVDFLPSLTGTEAKMTEGMV